MTTSTTTVTTVTRKYTWGNLQIRADFARAASRIEYHIDREGWIPTPFQVADFRHSPKAAIGGVNRWLAGEESAMRDRYKQQSNSWRDNGRRTTERMRKGEL